MSIIDKNEIIKILDQVIEPNTGQSIIKLDMVKRLQVQENQIRFNLVLPNLSTHKKAELNFACVQAIQHVYPQTDVHVHMEAGSTQAQSNSTTSANNPLPHVKNIIAIGSGKGGVGKSTISVNIALALKSLGAKVGILDADLYGPSIPTMLGVKNARPKIKDVYGQAKILPIIAYEIPIMSVGFVVEPEQAVVLRGPRLAGIIKQFIQDCIWPELDYLIVDLPPGTGDIQLTLVQTVPLTGAVMVTTPQKVALDDAIKGMNMFLLPQVNVPILGVVENMSWFTPAELPNNKYYIFGQGGGQALAKLGETVLLGQVPLVQSIRENSDTGTPVVLSTEESREKNNFLELAKNLATQISIRNNSRNPTERVRVK